MTLDPSPVVNVSKAARWLGVTPRTVTRLCKAGKLLGAYQPAGYQGMWLVPVVALQAIRAQPALPLSDLSDLSEGVA